MASSDSLDNVKKAAESLVAAIELLKNLEKDNKQLMKIFTDAEKQADDALKMELEEIEVSDIDWKGPMCSLRVEAANMTNLCNLFIECKKELSKIIHDYADKDKRDVTASDFQKIVNKINKLIMIAADFGQEFKIFLSALKDAQAAANEVTNKINDKIKEMESERNRQRFKGGAGAVALGGLASVLIFFSGGLAAPLVAGAVAAGGAVASGAYACSTGDLTKLIDKLNRDVESLKIHINHLEELIDCSNSQCEHNQQIQEAMRQVMQDCMHQIQEKKEREEMIEKIQQKDKKIQQQNEEMEQMRKELQKLKSARD